MSKWAIKGGCLHTPKLLDSNNCYCSSSLNYCQRNYYHHQTTAGGTATAHRHQTTAGGTATAQCHRTTAGGTIIIIELLLEELLLLIIIELLLEELLSSSNYCWRTAIAQGNYYINLAPIAETMATEMKYADILCYKANTTNKYCKGLTDNEKRNIRDKASKYVYRWKESFIHTRER